MLSRADGWHDAVIRGAGPGTSYSFRLPDGLTVPDPASRFQPGDVHGPSEVIDPESYAWLDGQWMGRPWTECVLYELHVGTFTQEGTFRAAAERLDHLADLGVTAIELMPIADFPGRWNWGYDGVLPFAPDSSYGRPDDLKALVDACHDRGIMVLLDVVYNHFGPEGNYLPSYAPVLTETHHTPWGAAVNYDAESSDVVRRFVIDNALYWINEYHLDGLRLDAVHAIKDDSPEHLLEVLAREVRSAAGQRHVHLILENEENEAHRLERGPAGEPAQFTAQWNDDIHHVLHTAATGERSGYYAEYAGDTGKLARALAEGFAFQGERMDFRGSPRGERSVHLPPTAFVSFIQNHDQIGNRAFGDRLSTISSEDALRALVAVYLLLPQVPMLFMGEEWGAAQPFPFFCDFSAELAEAVRSGRRNEFARFPEFQDPEKRDAIPDPTTEATFGSAKLVWSDLAAPCHDKWLAFYKDLLALRHAEITPRLPEIACGGSADVIGAEAVRVRWTLAHGTLELVANLTAEALDVDLDTTGRLLWAEGIATSTRLGPWSVVWRLHANEPT